jgi:hypothetical protein
MTLPIPLTVQLSSARTIRHIERDLRSLSFRSVAPGGFASAQFSLDRPLALSPDEIAYYADVDIFDARNGNTVWCGRLEDPGRGVGSDGQVWDLAAVGPSAHAQDRTVPLIYVDRDLTHWYPSNVSNEIKTSTVSVIEYVNDVTLDAFEMKVNSSGSDASVQGLATNSVVRRRYGMLQEFGQLLARFDFKHIEGRSLSSLRVQGFVGAQQLAARDDAFSTSESGASPKVMTTDFQATNNVLEILLRWTGAAGTKIVDDVTWTSVGGLYVMAQRLTKSGATVGASGYTTHTVLAHQVVEDLLGRLLTKYDGANATVATNTYAIDHMAYPDGATAAKILDDLMLFEPGYFWQATDRNSAGKYKFEWKAWPTTVRYEASVEDGYRSTGSADGLYNAVTIRWRDARGRFRTTRRTQTVAELDFTRDAFIDLGDEVSSSTNAVQAGDQLLAEHLTPPNAGTLTIARPIYDHDRGTRVMPWEIRPGHLIRVRGITPNPNSLNVTGRDGVTVFQIVGVDYDTSSASATLELDSYSPTVARALAAMSGRGGTRSATRGAPATLGAWGQRRR